MIFPRNLACEILRELGVDGAPPIDDEEDDDEYDDATSVANTNDSYHPDPSNLQCDLLELDPPKKTAMTSTVLGQPKRERERPVKMRQVVFTPYKNVASSV